MSRLTDTQRAYQKLLQLLDQEIRNQAAHGYKALPKEANDVSAWLLSREKLVESF